MENIQEGLQWRLFFRKDYQNCLAHDFFNLSPSNLLLEIGCGKRNCLLWTEGVILYLEVICSLWMLRSTAKKGELLTWFSENNRLDWRD